MNNQKTIRTFTYINFTNIGFTNIILQINLDVSPTQDNKKQF